MMFLLLLLACAPPVTHARSEWVGDCGPEPTELPANMAPPFQVFSAYTDGTYEASGDAVYTVLTIDEDGHASITCPGAHWDVLVVGS